MDIDGIEPGEDFVEVLEHKLANTQALLVLIGRDWLTCKDRNGRIRLNDPGDFVRLAVATALRKRIRVIPLLIDDASMPEPEQLPDDLKPLSRRQALQIDHVRFKHDVATLLASLEKLLTPASGSNTDTHGRLEAQLPKMGEKVPEEKQRARRKDKAAQQGRTHAAAERLEKKKKDAEEKQRELLEAETAQQAQDRTKSERVAREKREAGETLRKRQSVHEAGQRAEGERMEGEFAKLFPAGLFELSQPRAKQQSEADARDVQAWMDACKAHNYTAYESYGKSFPAGKYHDVALQRYRQLKPFWKKDSFQAWQCSLHAGRGNHGCSSHDEG